MKTPAKKTKPLLLIAGLALICALGSLAGCKPSPDKILELTAEQMNKSVPMMVDKETRLDKTTTAPGNTLVYHYTLVNLESAAIQKDAFVKQMRPAILNQYKTNEQMKSLRDMNVTLEYQYLDKAGVEVAKFAVSPKDF